jgi:hypothetical protein
VHLPKLRSGSQGSAGRRQGTSPGGIRCFTEEPSALPCSPLALTFAIIKGLHVPVGGRATTRLLLGLRRDTTGGATGHHRRRPLSIVPAMRTLRDPLLEAEALGLGTEPEAEEEPRRQHRDIGRRRNRPSRSRPAQDARSARRIRGAFARPMSLVCSRRACELGQVKPIESTTCASLFRHPGLAQASPVGSFEQGAYLRYLEISGLQAGEAPIEVVI